MKRKYFILLIILVIFISIFNPFISSKVKAVNQSFNLENLLNLIPNDFQENNEIILDSIEINNVRKNSYEVHITGHNQKLSQEYEWVLHFKEDGYSFDFSFKDIKNKSDEEILPPPQHQVI